MPGWMIVVCIVCGILASVAGQWFAAHTQPKLVELDANGMEEGFEQDLDFGPNAETGQIIDGGA